MARRHKLDQCLSAIFLDQNAESTLLPYHFKTLDFPLWIGKSSIPVLPRILLKNWPNGQLDHHNFATAQNEHHLASWCWFFQHRSVVSFHTFARVWACWKNNSQALWFLMYEFRIEKLPDTPKKLTFHLILNFLMDFFCLDGELFCRIPAPSRNID